MNSSNKGKYRRSQGQKHKKVYKMTDSIDNLMMKKKVAEDESMDYAVPKIVQAVAERNAGIPPRKINTVSASKENPTCKSEDSKVATGKDVITSLLLNLNPKVNGKDSSSLTTDNSVSVPSVTNTGAKPKVPIISLSPREMSDVKLLTSTMETKPQNITITSRPSSTVTPDTVKEEKYQNITVISRPSTAVALDKVKEASGSKNQDDQFTDKSCQIDTDKQSTKQFSLLDELMRNTNEADRASENNITTAVKSKIDTNESKTTDSEPKTSVPLTKNKENKTDNEKKSKVKDADNGTKKQNFEIEAAGQNKDKSNKKKNGNKKRNNQYNSGQEVPREVWKCRDPGCKKYNPLDGKYCCNCGLAKQAAKREPPPQYGRQSDKKLNSWTSWKETNCWLAYIDTPVTMYFHVGCQRSDFVKLDITVNDYMTRRHITPQRIELEHQVYAGFYDSKWWRIKVIKDHGDDTYKVDLIDNGARIYLHYNNIGLLEENMSRLTPLVNRYILHSLTMPSTGAWDPRAIDYVKQQLANKRTTLEVMSLDCRKSGGCRTYFVNVFAGQCFLNYDLLMLKFADLKTVAKKDLLFSRYNEFRQECNNNESLAYNEMYGNHFDIHKDQPFTGYSDIPNPFELLGGRSDTKGPEERDAVFNFAGYDGSISSVTKHYEHLLHCINGKLRAYETIFEKCKDYETFDHKLEKTTTLLCEVAKQRKDFETELKQKLGFDKIDLLLQELPLLQQFLDDKLIKAKDYYKSVNAGLVLTSEMLEELVTNADKMKINSTKVKFEMLLLDTNENEVKQKISLQDADFTYENFQQWKSEYDDAKQSVDVAVSDFSKNFVTITEQIQQICTSGVGLQLVSVDELQNKLEKACEDEMMVLSKSFPMQKIVEIVKTQMKICLSKISRIETLANLLLSSVMNKDLEMDTMMEDNKDFPPDKEVKSSITLLQFLIRTPQFAKFNKVLLIKDICQEIEAYHKNNEAYIYLNPENVEINQDGCAQLVPKHKIAFHEPIPPWSFKAPEVCNEGKSSDNLAADIYSLGQIIIWLFCLGEKHQLSMMINKDSTLPGVKHMINDDPTQRPTIGKVSTYIIELSSEISEKSAEEFESESNPREEVCSISDVTKSVEDIIADEEEAIMKEFEDSPPSDPDTPPKEHKSDLLLKECDSSELEEKLDVLVDTIQIECTSPILDLEDQKTSESNNKFGNSNNDAILVLEKNDDIHMNLSANQSGNLNEGLQKNGEEKLLPGEIDTKMISLTPIEHQNIPAIVVVEEE